MTIPHTGLVFEPALFFEPGSGALQVPSLFQPASCVRPSPGNLLVIAFVSYFGAKLHRPKIIAVGCVLMSIGTFIIALPHFIIGR